MNHVLDASVILAALNNESGADLALELLASGSVSAVNLSEVVGKLQRKGMDDDAIATILESLDCEVVPFDKDQAVLAGLMTRLTAPRGLSLGDRACLALAASRYLPCFTAERAWLDLPLRVDVRLIR